MNDHPLTHTERMRACLAGEALDRPPVALWRHFPVDDQAPDELAAASLAFQQTFDFDLVKVSPASSYCLIDWGVQDVWTGDPEGTRSYTRTVVHSPEDWERLSVLDPHQGRLGAQLDCLRLVVGRLGLDTPVIQTVFNPLSQAKNLVGKNNLLAHMRRYPDAVHAGLETITETTRRFIEAAAGLGIAGVFYAVQHAQYGVLSLEEYQEFGLAYDRQSLEPASNLWLNMIHLHGNDVMFDEVVRAGLPIHVVNWHDRDTPPSLSEAQTVFDGVLCGGLRIPTVTLGTPEQVREEARSAIEATSGSKFLLGTGCVTPTIAPYGNIMAARQSVEN